MRFCRSAFILLKCVRARANRLLRRAFKAASVGSEMAIADRLKKLKAFAGMVVMPEKGIYFADLRGNGFNGVMSRMRSEARASDRQ